jgi:ribonuclease HI
MSYAARTTTNNMAENLGLLAGLTACNNYGFSPLHVIGDSAMIIRQHTQRKAPKAIHLRPIYWRSRRQLTGIQVLSWQHHFRAQNKMADLLANMAMDSKKSMQVQLDMEQLRLTQWRPLVDFAGGDIGHWLLKNADMGSTGALADTL